MNRINIRLSLLLARFSVLARFAVPARLTGLACLAALVCLQLLVSSGTALSVLGQGEHEKGGKGDLERAGQKAAEISRGKMVFVKATCWGCHPHGENSMNGDKPLKGPAFAKQYKSDGRIVAFVRKGSPDAGMPPFSKEKLSDSDLKSVIVYIRSLNAQDAK